LDEVAVYMEQREMRPESRAKALTGVTTKHHRTLTSFEAAADKGCQLCIRLLGRLNTDLEDYREKCETSNLQSSDNFDESFLKFLPASWGNSDPSSPPKGWIIVLAVTVVEYCFGRRKNLRHLRENLDLHPTEPQSISAPEEDHCSSMETSTCSRLAQNLLRKWLGECSCSHQLCNSSEGGASAPPARLLSVANGRLHLVDMSEYQHRPRYLTLSHCWGKIDIITLTQNNKKEFEAAIPHESLCQTFKDAVALTRELGEEYIWIDSLCIIQDDPEDWRREASKMSGVYGGSYLNIAASGACDGSVGLAFDRPNNLLQRIRRYQIEIGKKSFSRWYDCINPYTYVDSVMNSPLVERAWAFQERFLAPRTVHFTITQLYWECKSKIACEACPERLPQSPIYDLGEQDKIGELWNYVVLNYSRCEMTFSRDRLVAISGVAKWLHSKTGDEYIVGLWRRNLEYQLLWKATGTRTTRRSPDDLPSWSWAALKGAIIPGSEHERTRSLYQLLITVVNIDLTFAGSDTYGEVNSGRIRLRTTSLIPCTFESRGGGFARTKFLNEGWTNLDCSNDIIGADFEMGIFYLVPVLAMHPANRRQRTSFKDWTMTLDGVFKLPFEVLVEGLVLKPVRGFPGGHFRRVGHFSDHNRQDVLRAMEDRNCWADESVYESTAGEDEEGRKQYHIVIF